MSDTGALCCVLILLLLKGVVTIGEVGAIENNLADRIEFELT